MAVKKPTKKKAVEKPEVVILKPLFTAVQLKKIEAGLMAQRNALVKVMEEKRAKDLETALANNPSQGDDADVANQTYEKEMIFEISSNERENIKQIDEALRKIKMKTYGYCDSCRKPIPMKRLNVIPQSRYCLACQAIYERNQ